MTHHLKLEEQYYRAKLEKRKLFEIRINDRTLPFMSGDTVVYSPIFKTPDGTLPCVDLPKIQTTITYVLRNFPALDPRYVVFGETDIKIFE